MDYYDGTKLLSLKDINGNTPEIFMVTTNRSGGKTTYFSRLLVNKFFQNGEKFMVLYRYKDDLSNVADLFFKDIKGLFFPNHDMTAKKQANGVYYEYFMDGKSCGYATAINCSEKIKRMSHLFSDVSRIMLDEFQSETGNYCPNEVNKFMSIHHSVARGQGKQSRYVPVFMIANPVSMINPYYKALGITARLDSKTRFLRGNGWILEQGYNESASRAQEESAFNRAFSEEKYAIYGSQGVYLNDNLSFIEKMGGRSKYLCTLVYKNNKYSVRLFYDTGFVFCDNKIDETYPIQISVTPDDHKAGLVLINQYSYVLTVLKQYFEQGCFRFKNIHCKEVIMVALSI